MDRHMDGRTLLQRCEDTSKKNDKKTQSNGGVKRGKGEKAREVWTDRQDMLADRQTDEQRQSDRKRQTNKHMERCTDKAFQLRKCAGCQI